MSTIVYALTALAEIARCFVFWTWLQLDGSPLWLMLGIGSLVVFGLILTRVETDFAGCAYAAYGGVYMVASLV